MEGAWLSPHDRSQFPSQNHHMSKNSNTHQSQLHHHIYHFSWQLVGQQNQPSPITPCCPSNHNPTPHFAILPLPHPTCILQQQKTLPYIYISITPWQQHTTNIHLPMSIFGHKPPSKYHLHIHFFHKHEHILPKACDKAHPPPILLPPTNTPSPASQLPKPFSPCASHLSNHTIQINIDACLLGYPNISRVELYAILLAMEQTNTLTIDTYIFTNILNNTYLLLNHIKNPSS